jgi:3-carboxy-cis,cis-muconate cycloisomerase
MSDPLDDDALLAGMIRFEVELAAACAARGVIPPEAARIIAEVAGGFRPDTAALLAEARSAGPLTIPFVRALRRAVAARDDAAAAALHLGATSQDALDTALCLMARAASRRLVDDALALTDSLATLAERHDATVMLGRTLLQGAQPITLGLRAAHWAALLGDAARATRRAARRAAVLQLGGAVGTLAALGPDGPAVARALGGALGLPWPGAPWHARRGDIAALGAALGILIGACGKVARDIALMMQTGVAEAREPGGGSSAMPHKRNPVATVAVAAAALRAPGLVAGLLAGLPANELERGVGGWQSERPLLAELFRLADAAVADLAAAVGGLEVDAARMARNLAELGGADASEAAVLALTPRLGRAAAERRVADALARGGDFLAALDAPEAAALADPAARTGCAAAFSATLVARARHGAGRGPSRYVDRGARRQSLTVAGGRTAD